MGVWTFLLGRSRGVPFPYIVVYTIDSASRIATLAVGESNPVIYNDNLENFLFL